MANREVIYSLDVVEKIRHRLGADESLIPIFTGIIPRRRFSGSEGENLEMMSSPSEIVGPSNLLNNSEHVLNFFSRAGFEIVDPLHIINANIYKTTDFVGAGIQMIEDLIHQPTENESFVRFVAQPSFRTQHIGGTTEGFSPTFVNMASVGVGIDFERHCGIIKTWEDYLVSLGMSRDKIQYQENWVQKQWGETKMIGHEVYFCYQGFPLGDASFNMVTEGSNSGFCFSDTGFGMERIKWLLNGGRYQQTFFGSNISYDDICYADACRIHALTLLVGQGVLPGANGKRAKVRRLSREIVQNGLCQYDDMGKCVGDSYDKWRNWGNLSMPRQEVVEVILEENQANTTKVR